MTVGHLQAAQAFVVKHSNRYNALVDKHRREPLSGLEDIELMELTTARHIVMIWAVKELRHVTMRLKSGEQCSGSIIWRGLCVVAGIGDVSVGVLCDSHGAHHIFYHPESDSELIEMTTETVTDWRDDLNRTISMEVANFLNRLMKHTDNKSLTKSSHHGRTSNPS